MPTSAACHLFVHPLLSQTDSHLQYKYCLSCPTAFIGTACPRVTALGTACPRVTALGTACPRVTALSTACSYNFKACHLKLLPVLWFYWLLYNLISVSKPVHCHNVIHLNFLLFSSRSVNLRAIGNCFFSIRSI